MLLLVVILFVEISFYVFVR